MSQPMYSWASYAPVQVSAAHREQPPIEHDQDHDFRRNVGYAHCTGQCNPQPLVGRALTPFPLLEALLQPPPLKHMPTPSKGSSGTAAIKQTHSKSYKKSKLRCCKAKKVKEALSREIDALQKRVEELNQQLSYYKQMNVCLTNLYHIIRTIYPSCCA